MLEDINSDEQDDPFIFFVVILINKNVLIKFYGFKTGKVLNGIDKFLDRTEKVHCRCIMKIVVT